jgi:hypothetical protein
LSAIVRAAVVGCPESAGDMEQGDGAVADGDEFLAGIGQVGDAANANESASVTLVFHSRLRFGCSADSFVSY